MNKKAVFFDAGGTLFCPYPSVGAICSGIAQKYKINVSENTINERFAEEFTKRDGLKSLVNTTNEKQEYVLKDDYFPFPPWLRARAKITSSRLAGRLDLVRK